MRCAPNAHSVHSSPIARSRLLPNPSRRTRRSCASPTTTRATRTSTTRGARARRSAPRRRQISRRRTRRLIVSTTRATPPTTSRRNARRGTPSSSADAPPSRRNAPLSKRRTKRRLRRNPRTRRVHLRRRDRRDSPRWRRRRRGCSSDAGKEPVRARDARDVRGGGVRGGRGVDSFHRAGRRRTRARVVRAWRVMAVTTRTDAPLSESEIASAEAQLRDAQDPDGARMFRQLLAHFKSLAACRAMEPRRARARWRTRRFPRETATPPGARSSIDSRTPPSAHRKGHERGGAGRRPPRRRRRECRRLRESRRLRGASEPEERPARRRPRRRAGRPSRERENEHDVEDS